MSFELLSHTNTYTDCIVPTMTQQDSRDNGGHSTQELVQTLDEVLEQQQRYAELMAKVKNVVGKYEPDFCRELMSGVKQHSLDRQGSESSDANSSAASSHSSASSSRRVYRTPSTRRANLRGQSKDSKFVTR